MSSILQSTASKHGPRSGESVLALMGDCFSKAIPHKGQSPSGVEIKGAKEVVPYILDYLRNKSLSIELNGRPAANIRLSGHPKVKEDALYVPLIVSGPLSDTLNIQSGDYPVNWPSPFIKEMCSGRWAKSDYVSVRMNPNSIIPLMSYNSMKGEGKLEWTAPPLFRGRYKLLGMFSFSSWSFGLKSFVIDEYGGQLSVTGIPDAWLPRFLWR